jgi:uncharacterized protein (TIGR02001 family)
VGVSVGLQSDYLYRGRTLSDGRPALTLNASYDHRSGLYAGGALTAQQTRRDGMEIINRVAYAGYVARPKTGPAWDLGVTNSHVVDYRFGERTFDYSEAYAGLLTDHVSLRVYYAPDYYDSGIRTLYTDLGAAIRPTQDMRLFGHVGALTPVGGRRGPGARRTRYDFSAGVARRVRSWEFSLSWARVAPAVYVGGRKERDTLVAGAAYFF